MKTLLLFLALACGACQPMTPEQRASVGRSFAIAQQSIQNQQQIMNQGYAQMQQNAARPLYQPPPTPPTYMVYPQVGGTLMISPTGY